MLPDMPAITAPNLALPAAWRVSLVWLGAVWLGLIGLFWGDWRAMAHQWWDSSTYSHILFVPVILGWLVAQRLPGLFGLQPRIWGGGLWLMGGALLLWALGALAGFAQVTQIAAVAMLAASVPLLLGLQASAGLAFPLFYMGFLVPFGDEIVPLLQMITAKITIALVHLSGVEARIDGVFIDTPAGLFEVAEACSGIKFLIAMLAFGALAAHVCFLSWKRRAAFMALCVVGPVLANGVRAWGTIYLGQIFGREVAGGIDHLIYGWFFFAAVIAAILATGWRWFDRPAGAPMLDLAAIGQMGWIARLQPPAAPDLAPAKALGALGLLLAVALGWVAAADRMAAPMPAQIALPQVAGWARAPYAPRQPWQPLASGAAHRLLGRYVDGQGHQVDVFFALYDAQGPGKKAGGYGQGALPLNSQWAWKAPGPAIPLAKTDLLLAGGPTERLVATYYKTGDLVTGSNLALKLANIADRLLLRRRATMLLLVSSEDRAPQASIAAFLDAAGAVGPWMDGMAQEGEAR